MNVRRKSIAVSVLLLLCALFLVPVVMTADSPPRITAVTSSQSEGVYGLGTLFEIYVTFDKPVNVAGGTPAIALNSGGIATYVDGSGSATLTFTYTSMSGDSTAGLDWVSADALATNGASIEDAVDGTPADLTVSLPALGAASGIVIDTTPPSASTFTINGGVPATNAPAASLAFQYADDYSSAGEASVSKDGVAWSGWQPTTDDYTDNFGAEGVYTYYVKFRDAAGNETDPVSNTIIYDITPPTGTLLIRDGAPSTMTGQPFPLTLSASDNFTAFQDLQVRLSDMSGYTTGWLPIAEHMSFANNYGGGMAYVYAAFRDQAGNVSATVTDTIINDFYAPTGTLSVNGGAAGTTSPVLTVAYSAADPQAGVPVIVEIWSSDDSTRQRFENVPLAVTHTMEYTVADSDGKKTIYMQVTDPAGRVSPVYSKEIWLDRVAPSGSLVIAGGAAVINTANTVLTVDRSGTDAVSVRYSDDGTTWSEWEPYSNTKSYTLPAGDGEKTVYAQLRDVAGNMSDVFFDRVQLDTTAPDEPVITLSTTEPATSVTVTITYPEDAVTHSYQIWGENAVSYTVPFTLTANGTLSAYAVDTAGNQSTATVEIVNIDLTPPAGTLSIAEGEATADSNVTLLIDDADSGASVMRFSDDGTDWTDWEPYGTMKSYTLPGGDGIKTVYLQLRDAAGNVSGTMSAVIILDTIAPDLPVFTVSTTAPAQSVTVTIDYPDDAAARTYRIDGGNEEDYTEPLLIMSNGTITAYARDAAGNETTFELAVSNIDRTPPSVILSILEGALTDDPNVMLLLSDEDSGAEMMRFSDDGTNWSEWESYAAEKAYVLPGGDGEKAVHVQFIDAAGNIGSGTAPSIVLDTTPPEAPVIVLSTMEPALSVTVTIDYPDDAAVRVYSIGDGDPVHYPGPFTVTSNVTITAYAYDNAGHESYAAAVVSNIDVDPPSGSVIIEEGATVSDPYITLLIGSGDPDVRTMRFSNDGADWSVWETYNTVREYVLPPGNGEKTVFVQLRDTAGNVSDPISASIELDMTAPDAPVITLSTKEAAQSVTVTIDYPDDAVTRTYRIGEGVVTTYTEPFTIHSNTMIEAFAYDAVGNEAKTAIDITNIDTTPPTGSIAFREGTVTSRTNVTLLISDEGSGAEYMRFSVDGASWSEWEPYDAAKLYVLPPGDGEKKVYVQFRDAAGNVSADTISASIILEEPGTIDIVSAVAYGSGTQLTVRFAGPVDLSVQLEGLSLTGTSAVISGEYDVEGPATIVIRLDRAIEEQGNVTLHVGGQAFRGKYGEKVLPQSVSIITPHVIRELQEELERGEPGYTIEEAAYAIGQQRDVVGEPEFDRYDAGFWLRLLNPAS